jgi:hypothetical protein
MNNILASSNIDLRPPVRTFDQEKVLDYEGPNNHSWSGAFNPREASDLKEAK